MTLNVKHFAEIDSTNDYALSLIDCENLTSDIAVVADKQTSGRGRLNGRVWQSPKGNFYCSYIVNLEDFQIFIGKASILTSMVMDVLYKYLIKMTQTNRITLKQPNDILVNGKKLAGVLTEVSYPYAVIGIGINLINAPIERATDLKSEFNLLVKPTELVENFYEFLISALKK